MARAKKAARPCAETPAETPKPEGAPAAPVEGAAPRARRPRKPRAARPARPQDTAERMELGLALFRAQQAALVVERALLEAREALGALNARLQEGR